MADSNNNKPGVSRRHSQPSAKVKVQPSSGTSDVAGDLLTFGSNDCGQLGLECSLARYPRRVVLDTQHKVRGVCAGGMHTVVLLANGEVWTFGNNDDHALGREAEEEEEMRTPGRVDIGKDIIQISAGDSHSAALASDGTVYYWGTFRDNNGDMGLVFGSGPTKRTTPERLVFQGPKEVKIVKIQSGNNHLAMLSEDGVVYTCGHGEEGQLGRFYRSFRVGPNQREFSLRPTEVRLQTKTKFVDMWAGKDATICKAEKTGAIWVFGINSNGQLGIDEDTKIIATPRKSISFQGKIWKQIAVGEHHAVALDVEGKVYTLGRSDDGRLGIENPSGNLSEPTLNPTLANYRCVQVACGGSVAYAVREDGTLYAWGFGENWQMGNGSDVDCNVPTPCRGGKDLDKIDGKVVFVSAGAQHSVIITTKTN